MSRGRAAPSRLTFFVFRVVQLHSPHSGRQAEQYRYVGQYGQHCVLDRQAGSSGQVAAGTTVNARRAVRWQYDSHQYTVPTSRHDQQTGVPPGQPTEQRLVRPDGTSRDDGRFSHFSASCSQPLSANLTAPPTNYRMDGAQHTRTDTIHVSQHTATTCTPNACHVSHSHSHTHTWRRTHLIHPLTTHCISRPHLISSPHQHHLRNMSSTPSPVLPT